MQPNELGFLAMVEIVKLQAEEHKQCVKDSLLAAMAWAERENLYVSSEDWIRISAKAFAVYGMLQGLAHWLEEELDKGNGAVGPWPGSQTMGRVSIACMLISAGKDVPEQFA